MLVAMAVVVMVVSVVIVLVVMVVVMVVEAGVVKVFDSNLYSYNDERICFAMT